MAQQTIKVTRKGKDTNGPGLLLTREVPAKITPLLRPTPAPGADNPYKQPASSSAGYLVMQKLAAARKKV